MSSSGLLAFLFIEALLFDTGLTDFFEVGVFWFYDFCDLSLDPIMPPILLFLRNGRIYLGTFSLFDSVILVPFSLPLSFGSLASFVYSKGKVVID